MTASRAAVIARSADRAVNGNPPKACAGRGEHLDLADDGARGRGGNAVPDADPAGGDELGVGVDLARPAAADRHRVGRRLVGDGGVRVDVDRRERRVGLPGVVAYDHRLRGADVDGDATGGPRRVGVFRTVTDDRHVSRPNDVDLPDVVRGDVTGDGYPHRGTGAAVHLDAAQLAAGHRVVGDDQVGAVLRVDPSLAALGDRVAGHDGTVGAGEHHDAVIVVRRRAPHPALGLSFGRGRPVHGDVVVGDPHVGTVGAHTEPGPPHVTPGDGDIGGQPGRAVEDRDTDPPDVAHGHTVEDAAA